MKNEQWSLGFLMTLFCAAGLPLGWPDCPLVDVALGYNRSREASFSRIGA
jgi:hypothetical protein